MAPLTDSSDYPAKMEISSVSLIDRSLHLPLYVQIKRELLRRIASTAREEQGHRFHSDEELCVEFNVSRMTVRQAIKELVDEGYLTRARGLGTFLTAQKVSEHPLRLTSDRATFGAQPFDLSIRRFETVSCPPEVGVQLGIAPKTPVCFALRVRSAGGVKVSIDHRWLPLDVAEGLTAELMSQQTLVQFIGQRYALEKADMQFEGGLASPGDATLLGILPGDAVLTRLLVYSTSDGRAVMAGRSTHRSDLSRYAISLPIGRASESETTPP
jgi:GntR family transcriptional regulator